MATAKKRKIKLSDNLDDREQKKRNEHKISLE